MRIINPLKIFGYLLKSRPYKLEKPFVLQFPVIDICNSRCQMCHIWKNKASDAISVDELRKGLRNPLFDKISVVGINGGEPTLRKDLGSLASVLFEELPKLHALALITNAYNSQEVIDRITEVGLVTQKHGGMLDVMVSLDGYGDVHDRVRGKPGNFERAQKVIEFIQASPLVANVRIGCTIIKENVYGLADLFEYCQDKGLYVKYRLGIPHQRLYTQNLSEPFALTAEEKYHIAEFMEGLIAHYETNEQQKFFYRSLVDQLLHNAPRKSGCDWQHRGATLTSRGELLYCAVQSKVLGKITEDDSQKIYFANQAHLHEIIENKCAGCNHDYVGIPPRGQYAKQLTLQTLRAVHLESTARRIYRNSSACRWLKKKRFAAKLESLKALAPSVESSKLCRIDSPRVLICGWYGTETLGDKAILGGVVKSLRQALGNVEFTLASLHPYVSEMTRRQMPELKELCIVTPHEAIQLAGNMDLVVFGGGPLMALDELAEMEAIFFAATKNGVATLVAGCGVGPLGDDWHNSSLRRILEMTTLRIYRDEKSRNIAATLGIETNCDFVAEDPAFTWLKDQTQLNSVTPPKKTKVLLLGLRDFPHLQYARHLSESECLKAKQHYEREIITTLEQLIACNPSLTLRPLPMCTNHFGDDDRWFYRRIFRGNDRLLKRIDFSFLGADLPPPAYAKAFRESHAALTMRFHSIVFALGLGIPTVAIDYTLGKGKVHAIAQRFDLPCQSLLNLDAAFLVQEISTLLSEASPKVNGFTPKFEATVREALPQLLKLKRNTRESVSC